MTLVENPYHDRTTYDNLNTGSRLEIHPIVIEIEADDEDGFDNNGGFHHKVEDFSDPDVDEVPDDIDNEYTIEKSSLGIVICNDFRTHMLSVDLDAVYAYKFPKYSDIIFAHRLTLDPESKELFMGQQFLSKNDCIFSIKRYSMKVSIDYKVAESKTTLYVGECWRSIEGCN